MHAFAVMCEILRYAQNDNWRALRVTSRTDAILVILMERQRLKDLRYVRLQVDEKRFFVTLRMTASN